MTRFLEGEAGHNPIIIAFTYDWDIATLDNYNTLNILGMQVYPKIHKRNSF